MGPGAGAAALRDGVGGATSGARWMRDTPDCCTGAGAGAGATPGFTTTVPDPGDGPGNSATLGGGTEGAAGPATAGAV